MAKSKFHFNPSTLTYEKIEHSVAYYLKYILLHLLSGLSLGVLFFVLFASFFASPRERELLAENRELKAQYRLLDKKADDLQDILALLAQRDNNMYRVIYQADPISSDVRRANYLGDRRYAALRSSPNAELLTSVTRRLDGLSRQVYIQSLSYDELIELAKRNEDRLRHLPAIQPILNRDLKRTASGYGVRIDPIYKTTRFHAGMDFASPQGSDIFVTADGTVSFSGWKQGYGNCIVVNHGYGYETLYGHMSKLIARRGAKVRRGDVIGKVGSTGKSTGPHLHYEVHYKGKVQNPMNYYFLDLSPREYDEMVQLSSNNGQVMD